MRNTWMAAVATSVLAIYACTGSDGDFVQVSSSETKQALGTSPATWVSQGPAPVRGGSAATRLTAFAKDVAGAVHPIAAHPTDPNIVYVGTTGGGVFKTLQADTQPPFDPPFPLPPPPRINWIPLTDDKPSLSISALTLDPKDSDSLAAGTGAYSSLGEGWGQAGYIYVSRNGGKSFVTVDEPSLQGFTISKLVLRGSSLYVASDREGDGRLMLGTEQPKTGWTFTSLGASGDLPSSFGAVFDLEADPTSPTRFYAVVGSRDSTADLGDSGLYRSDASGKNWVRISDNDLTGALPLALRYSNNARIAVASNGRLYVLVTTLGQPVYIGSSPDGGQTWVPMELPLFPAPEPVATPGLPPPLGIVSVSNALPMVVQTNGNHGFDFNAAVRVRISGVSGLPAANGDFVIAPFVPPGTTSESPNQFVLVDRITNANVDGSSSPTPGTGGVVKPYLGTQIGRALMASLAVDPQNPNVIYVGGHSGNDFIGTPNNVIVRGNINNLADGKIPSSQWTHIVGNGTSNNTVPHTETRDIAFDANGRLLSSSDGGIVRHSNAAGLGDWFNLNGNLNSAEVRSVSIDPLTGSLIVGLQDNGTSVQNPGKFGIPSAWDLILGADGTDTGTIIDTTTSPSSTLRYFSAQKGDLRRQNFDINGNGIGSDQKLALVAGTAALTDGPFQTNYAVNNVGTPANVNRLVIGWSDAVYESNDRGDTLTKVNGSPPEALNFAYGHSSNANDLWIAAGGNGLFRRQVQGNGATQLPLSMPAYDVVLSPTASGVAYVVGDGGVFYTDNGGQNFEDITGDLPAPVGIVRAVEYIPSGKRARIVVGVSGRFGALAAAPGVFMMAVDNPGVWTRVGDGLPHAGVMDLDYDKPRDLLAAGLGGRGVWTLSPVKDLDLAPVTDCSYIIRNADDTCRAKASYKDVLTTLSDPEGDPVTCVMKPSGSFPLGSTPVEVTCYDSLGAGSQCTGNVSVHDRTPPVFTFVPADIVSMNCSGLNLGIAEAEDTCGNTFVSNDAPAKFPPGTTTVTWTATDGWGNTTKATQRVTVFLGDDPTCCPDGTNVILGTSNDDNLNGTPGSDCILGLNAQDTINGNGGVDYISGGEGDDILDGGSGDDIVSGGSGQDRLSGGDGNDILLGHGGDDLLYGNVGDDTLYGGQGQDQLYGQEGNDVLLGEGGNDQLYGGDDDDDLVGGGLSDQCDGGSGNNTFVTCEIPGTDSCVDGSQNGTETGSDCGGYCPDECGVDEGCSSSNDCESGICLSQACGAGDPASGGSATSVTGTITMMTDWGSGYCAVVNVLNSAKDPVVDWSVTIDLPQSNVFTEWNGTFTSSSGMPTVAPSYAWNQQIDPGTIDSSIGFCANRDWGTYGMPTVVEVVPSF